MILRPGSVANETCMRGMQNSAAKRRTGRGTLSSHATAVPGAGLSRGGALTARVRRRSVRDRPRENFREKQGTRGGGMPWRIYGTLAQS